MENAQITRHPIYPRIPKLTVQEMVQPDGAVRVHLFEETYYSRYTLEITGNIPGILHALREVTNSDAYYTALPVTIGLGTEVFITRADYEGEPVIRIEAMGKFHPSLPINHHFVTMKGNHALRLIETLETIQHNHHEEEAA